MKHRVTGMVLAAALLGACSHAELRKMFHGEPERRVLIKTESPLEAYQKLPTLDTIFEAVAAARACDAGDLKVKCASFDWFRSSQLPPMLGRTFGPDEEATPRVAVLSEAFWEKRFKRDPGVIGRVIEIGVRKLTIVGVMPKDAGRSTDVFVPWMPAGDSMTLIALLRPGVDIKQAQAAADAAGVKGTVERLPAE